MKTVQKTLIVLAFVLVCVGHLFAQSKKQDCSKPSFLRVTKLGNDLYYQLDLHQKHKLFALGEVASAVTSCSPDRMIFVVADTNVSPMEIMLPEKEQITNVRYFVQFKGGDVVELSFGSTFPKLPMTPDIKGSPLGEDDLPPPLARAPAPKSGFIPNEKTAIKVAEAILSTIYGEKQITSERPFHAVLKDETWTIAGSLPKGWDGGVASIHLDKKTGAVISYIHGK
jgi:hypothetical protein